MKSGRTRHLTAQLARQLISFAIVGATVAATYGCGSADDVGMLSTDDYTIDGDVASSRSTPTAVAAADVVDENASERTVNIVAATGSYSPDDFLDVANFKKSKDYDVAGLTGADAAIYGFFGPDPYDRKEFEVRFYPDHDTAADVGVEFANEATGPDAVIASSVQRWDEGLVQRRACAGNTRGSHHSGRCDLAKYGDYVVAGNMVLLCQGKDSATALSNCQALMAELSR